jgi:hypothetical protein
MVAFVKAYQTLIVGLVGFLGVMATLAVNAWLARRAESRKIAHDARVLRTALIEEMKVERRALVHGSDTSKKATSKKASPDEIIDTERYSVLTPLRRYTDIFDQSIDKLGLLTSDEVAAVLDAYLPLKELTGKIRLLEQRIPRHLRRVEYGEGPPEEYARVAHEDLAVLADLYLIYVPQFDKAIEKLSANLKRD